MSGSRHTFHSLLFSPRRQDGFTLIELMVVVMVIGLLAAIGAANFARAQDTAKRAKCLAHQHQLHEMAILHANEQGIEDAVINAAALFNADLSSRELGECPSSGTLDFDDYQITYQAGEVTQLQCDIRGAEHLYEPN